MTARASNIAAFLILIAVLLSTGIWVNQLWAEKDSPTLDIIVDRKPDHIEIYIQLPGEAIESVFAGDVSQLGDTNGFVDFEGLRNGTWQHGAALFGKLKAASAENSINLEMTSLMVHPPNRTLPFRDPIEGLVATSVCGVEVPRQHNTLADLTANVGFYADVTSGNDRIELKLPSTGRKPVSVRVREFSNGQQIADLRSSLADSGLLRIPARSPYRATKY
ncbi:MAG: hypothetical protein AAGD43_08275 [Pseudomonadota bacterium]